MRLASSGGRRLTYAALAAREHVLGPATRVTRKDLSAASRMAAEALGLRCAVRLVLSELVANWGEQHWDRLVVWPSNDTLVRRTGLSERSVRDALRALVGHELIAPKMSPNGKRYPIRNGEGTVVDAYGFDLTPLYSQRDRWTERIAEQKAERLRIKRAFDEITIARRAAREALDALREDYPHLDIHRAEEQYGRLAARSPRRNGKMPPEDLVTAWAALRSEVEHLYFHAGNDCKNCRHIESQEDF